MNPLFRFPNARAVAARVLGAGCLLAASSCATAQAGDRCLPGTWQPQGNSMADWIKQRNPRMAMHLDQEAASLTLRADGSYAAGTQGQASAQGRDGISARMAGSFAAAGHWTSADGQLVLSPVNQDTDARMEVKGPRGASSRARIPRGAITRQQYAYRCIGNQLETRMQVPGTTDRVTQWYLRK